VTNWVANYLTQLDATPGPLFGIIDTNSMGLVGHSAGAVAALGAVEGSCQFPFCNPFISPVYPRPASLKAAVVHGYQNCDPISGQCREFNTTAAPVMIVNGQFDDAAAAVSAYGTLEPSRAIVLLDDVNHFGLTNDDLSSPMGPNPEPNGIPQPASIALTVKWTAVWLRAQIDGHPGSLNLLSKSRVGKATITSEL